MTTTLPPLTTHTPAHPTTPEPGTPRRLAWQHGPGKDLIADPGHLILRDPPHETLPLEALTALLPDPAEGQDRLDGPGWAAATAYALRAAVLPTRWDDWSAHNAHRPFPSPRAKQAHEIEVSTPGGSFAMDEVRGTLARTGAAGRPSIVVRTRVDRIPEGYGRMRITLSLLEIGHIVGELSAALTACGRRPAYAVDQHGPDDVTVVVTHSPHPRRDPREVSPDPGERPRRCSGLDVRGLSPDPRPLPTATLTRLLAGAPVSDPTLRHRVAVRGIEATPDGIVDITAAGLHEISRDDAHAAIDRAIRGPRGVLDIPRMNLLWGIASPLAQRLREPTDYPRLLVRVGVAAQDICRAAAAAGLFARPLRGIDEPDVEAALHLPAGEDLLYLLVLGKPRVHGFSYDLTPPTPPSLPPASGQPVTGHPVTAHRVTDHPSIPIVTAYRKDRA